MTLQLSMKCATRLIVARPPPKQKCNWVPPQSIRRCKILNARRWICSCKTNSLITSAKWDCWVPVEPPLRRRPYRLREKQQLQPDKTEPAQAVKRPEV